MVTFTSPADPAAVQVRRSLPEATVVSVELLDEGLARQQEARQRVEHWKRRVDGMEHGIWFSECEHEAPPCPACRRDARLELGFAKSDLARAALRNTYEVQTLELFTLQDHQPIFWRSKFVVPTGSVMDQVLAELASALRKRGAR